METKCSNQNPFHNKENRWRCLFTVSTVLSKIKEQVPQKQCKAMPFYWNTNKSKGNIQWSAVIPHTHTHREPTGHGFYNICHDNCHQPTQSTIYSFQTSKRPLTVKHNICNHKKQFLASRSSTAHLSFYLSQQQSTTSKHAWAGGMRGAIESAAPGRGWRAQNVN